MLFDRRDIDNSRIERGASFAPEILFPDWDAAILQQHRALMVPAYFFDVRGAPDLKHSPELAITVARSHVHRLVASAELVVGAGRSADNMLCTTGRVKA